MLPYDRMVEPGFAANETAALTTKTAMRAMGQERDLSRTPRCDESPSITDPIDPLPFQILHAKMAESELTRREASQHQTSQDIYITEVKRLLPGGQRENLQPSGVPGSSRDDRNPGVLKRLGKAGNPEIKNMETLISRSRKPE